MQAAILEQLFTLPRFSPGARFEPCNSPQLSNAPSWPERRPRAVPHDEVREAREPQDLVHLWTDRKDVLTLNIF